MIAFKRLHFYKVAVANKSIAKSILVDRSQCIDLIFNVPIKSTNATASRYDSAHRKTAIFKYLVLLYANIFSLYYNY